MYTIDRAAPCPFLVAVDECRYKLIINEDGDTIDMRGAFAINDGGYHKWTHTIAGSKDASATTVDEDRWSGTMESIRKDSERFFGIMKKRFRILHTQSLLHTSSAIDTVFKASLLLR